MAPCSNSKHDPNSLKNMLIRPNAILAKTVHGMSAVIQLLYLF